MTILVRFAPSPTGLLHVGNARTALLNWLFAKQQGGTFFLRIDDTDAERSKPEFEQAIIEDLHWLGLDHTQFARQSERFSAYDAAAEKLKAASLLYPCYESAEELDRRRKRQIAMRRPPVYDRAALKLTPDERTKLEAEGRKPHWRFKLSHSAVQWNDLLRGPVDIDTSHLSDPVLIREDGRYLYTLPSVVDDVDFKVSHIVRGEDHVTNTAAQVELFAALGATIPAFAHFPLLVGAGGEALSKRLGSLSLRSLREDGAEPLAVTSYLAKIGTSDPVDIRLSIDQLAEEFSFEKIGRAPAHFDPAELTALNGKLLHQLPYAAVQEKLTAMGITGGEAFWEAVKPNLTALADAGDLWPILTGPLIPVIEDQALASRAADLLPPEPWDETTWPLWTKQISAETGAKGRALFHPLRLAITAREHGPELKKLLPLIPREKVLARLKGKKA